MRERRCFESQWRPGADARQYDMREVIARNRDTQVKIEVVSRRVRQDGRFAARGGIGGWALGNRRQHKKHVPTIDVSHRRKRIRNLRCDLAHRVAEKEARVIMDCNQNLCASDFLHDVNGFIMVGKEAGWSGIAIRAGSKMVTPYRTAFAERLPYLPAGSLLLVIRPCAENLRFRDCPFFRPGHHPLSCRNERESAARQRSSKFKVKHLSSARARSFRERTKKT